MVLIAKGAAPALIEQFGASHLIALAVTAAVAWWMIRAARSGGGARRAELILAILLLTSYPAKILARMHGGIEVNADVALPMHLCDLAGLAGFFALVFRRPLMAELTYFWGLSGTVQALITPSICYEFPAASYFAFFQLHSGVVIAALYLPLGLGWRPRRGAVLRVWYWGLGYVAVACLVDWLLGANYGFFREVAAGSLMELLGPWPLYIGSMALLALPVFALLNLPFVGRDLTSSYYTCYSPTDRSVAAKAPPKRVEEEPGKKY